MKEFGLKSPGEIEVNEFINGWENVKLKIGVRCLLIVLSFGNDVVLI